MPTGNCRKCSHPMSEHTGRDGECRHDYETFTDRPKEQCLCINRDATKLVESEGTTLDR